MQHNQECILDRQPWDNPELYQPYERLFRDVWNLGPYEYKRVWMNSHTAEEFAENVTKSIAQARKYAETQGD